jgi:hypothetical protein
VLQKDLSSKNYNYLMMDELEDLHMIHLRAFRILRKTKCGLLSTITRR